MCVRICRVQVARVAQHHAVSAPTTQPLFVYMPFQNVHEPHQAPQSYIDKYNEVNNTLRRATCAMVTAMDDAVQTVVSGYVRAGLWDDTVLVFTTDNVSNLFIMLDTRIRVSRTSLRRLVLY